MLRRFDRQHLTHLGLPLTPLTWRFAWWCVENPVSTPPHRGTREPAREGDLKRAHRYRHFPRSQLPPLLALAALPAASAKKFTPSRREHVKIRSAADAVAKSYIVTLCEASNQEEDALV